MLVEMPPAIGERVANAMERVEEKERLEFGKEGMLSKPFDDSLENMFVLVDTQQVIGVRVGERIGNDALVDGVKVDGELVHDARDMGSIVELDGKEPVGAVGKGDDHFQVAFKRGVIGQFVGRGGFVFEFPLLGSTPLVVAQMAGNGGSGGFRPLVGRNGTVDGSDAVEQIPLELRSFDGVWHGRNGKFQCGILRAELGEAVGPVVGYVSRFDETGLFEGLENTGGEIALVGRNAQAQELFLDEPVVAGKRQECIAPVWDEVDGLHTMGRLGRMDGVETGGFPEGERGRGAGSETAGETSVTGR